MRKRQRLWLTILIALCTVLILVEGASYVFSLRANLKDQAVSNVLTVTVQQQQAFDNFILRDQERLHSFAHYFAENNSENIEAIQYQLTAFRDVNSYYTVINLQTGAFYNNKTTDSYQMEEERLEEFRSLSGSGVRSLFKSLYSDDMRFGYYECFTFADGVPGLIQKCYGTNEIFQEFSLSFYNDQGFAYVVNREGDILLRSVGTLSNYQYDNIIDLARDTSDEQQDIDAFVDELAKKKTGSRIFTGTDGAYVYTYVPLESEAEWYFVSIVRMSAIMEETNEILKDSQKTFLILVTLIVASTVFVLLIRQNNKAMKEKDLEIEYQQQLFDIFFSYLSNNTDDIYLMLSPEDNMRVEYISPNIERVLGVSPESVTSNLAAMGEGIYTTKEKINYEILRKMQPKDSLVAMKTQRVNQRTGELRRFQESVYCTLMQDKKKIMVHISDRTEEGKVQTALEDALKMAQVANAAKTTFLSSMSHDIRTPMNAIMGLVTMLREEADNPTLVLEYTQRIDAASQHLLGLINDVLDMSKIESGNATLHVEELNLAEVINEINTIIRSQTNAKKQEFEVIVSSVVHEQLLGDKLRINQVLINILSNAVKYTQEGGRICMRVIELPQIVENYCRIQFVISDNGQGMSEEYQKEMFSPFTREETATTGQIQGSGLGMAITKRLVDLMGGTIEVKSRQGEGSTFTVDLELGIQKQEEEQEFWTKHGISRVIVVDDDEEMCKVVVHAMSKTGVHTDYATDGSQVVQMMHDAKEEGHPYDVVLLDWKMPNLSGPETAKLIRKNYSTKLPILFLTAYDWKEVEREAKEVGIKSFISKPFFMCNFKEAILRVREEQEEIEKKEDNVVEGKHILVVDDIEVNRMILLKILGSLGAHCEAAENGQEAFERFENSGPDEIDLILMDVQMPVMNGYEATQAIRASSHPAAGRIPIIAMTANAFVDDVRDAINSGMNAHVAKPVQIDKLKATIRQVFDEQEQ